MNRCSTAVGAAALIVALAVVVAGCGNGRSILYKGIAPGGGPREVISDAAAVRDGKAIRRRWLADIARRGREYPAQRFHNLPAATFRARLAAAAARDHFTVKRVRFLHPRQVAPLVIVESDHYLGLAHAFGALLNSLEPRSGRGDAGLAYEGWLLEAQDERGVPFIILSGAIRGPDAGGGQWARSEELYPGPHG